MVRIYYCHHLPRIVLSTPEYSKRIEIRVFLCLSKIGKFLGSIEHEEVYDNENETVTY